MTDDRGSGGGKAAGRGMVWAGRVLSGLTVAFMLMDSVIKLVPIKPVTDSLIQLGYPVDLARPIGVIELVCTLLYLFPRTWTLAAVLLTGVYGGAIASHLRVGDPMVSHTLFGVYLGALMWGGIWLRDPRLRALFPLGRATA